MVGFITSAVTENESGTKIADMYMTIVRYGVEMAQDELFKHAFAEYERRGVTEIVSNMGTEWDNLQGFPERYGFKRTMDWVYSVATNPSQVDLSGYPEPPSLVKFDEEAHGEDLTRHFMGKSGDRKEARRLMSDRFFRTDRVWIAIDDGDFRALVRMMPSTHEPLSHLIWLRAFELGDQNDRELIRGLYRFSVEYAVSEGYTELDFHIGDRRYPIDKVQFEAIGEEPEVIRYEIRRAL
ncbi:MAG: hypothetical protein JSV27_03115 [Candidatus Bathyarchaeota archaeon]|nr:MAG: hypothetical protein JSV27_03115 [Candidatus Bathyarchaeota archaeon]